MPDYKQMYFSLFAAMCNAIDAIEKANYGEAKEIIVQAQQKTEDVYVGAGQEKQPDATVVFGSAYQ